MRRGSEGKDSRCAHFSVCLSVFGNDVTVGPECLMSWLVALWRYCSWTCGAFHFLPLLDFGRGHGRLQLPFFLGRRVFFASVFFLGRCLGCVASLCFLVLPSFRLCGPPRSSANVGVRPSCCSAAPLSALRFLIFVCKCCVPPCCAFALSRPAGFGCSPYFVGRPAVLVF